MPPTGDTPCVWSAQGDKPSEGLSSFKKLWTVRFRLIQTCPACKNLGHLCSDGRNSLKRNSRPPLVHAEVNCDHGAILQGLQLVLCMHPLLESLAHWLVLAAA